MTKHLPLPDGKNFAEVPDNWTQEMLNQSLQGLSVDEAQQGNVGQPMPPHTASPIRAMFPQNNAPVPVQPFVPPQRPGQRPNQGSAPVPVQVAPSSPASPDDAIMAAMPSNVPPLASAATQPQRPHSQMQTADSTQSSREWQMDPRPLFDKINDPKSVNSQPNYTLGPENQGEAINKAATTILRGGGEIASNIGDVVDFSIPRQFGENMIATARGQPTKSYAWPLSDAYTRAAPKVPEGYEGYNEFGKQALPIAAEVAFTSGGALPEILSGAGLRTTARDFMADPKSYLKTVAADPTAPVVSGIRGIGNAATKVARDPVNEVALPAAKFATRAGVDYIGGQYGSGLGSAAGWAGDRLIDFGKKSLGYDTSTPTNLLETPGEYLGGMTSAGGIRDIGNKALGFLRTDRSKEILAAFDSVNNHLRAQGKEPMPLSMAVPGSKGAGMMEDWTARGITSGKPAQDARYGQYRGMEEAVSGAADEVRGTAATGKITPETIGQDAQKMAIREEADTKAKVAAAQQAMVQNSWNVGPHVQPAELHNLLGNIYDPLNRNYGDVEKQTAKHIDDRFRADYTQPLSGHGPPQPPQYSVAKDFRTRLGPTLPSGAPLDTKVTAPTYEQLTNMLRNASGTQNYDEVQKFTKERLEGLKEIAPIIDAKNEKEAYNAATGGKNSNSVDQLKFFNQAGTNAPELPKLLADNLEYKLRGNNAGELPDPRTWTPDLMKKWDDMGPDARSAYTNGDKDLEKHLDDVSTLAKTDLSRPGGRSKPGKVGSTIGTAGPLAGGAALGAGLTASMGHDNLWPMITTGLAGAGIGSAAANFGLGRLLTNEKFVRHVVENAPMTGLRRAGSAGAGLSILLQNKENQAQAAEANKRNQAADDARIKRWNERGGAD